MTAGSPSFGSLPTWLELDRWEYSELFDPMPAVDYTSLMSDVRHLARSANLPSHPFFKLAAREMSALELWVTQELVMTNSFSQLVLYAAAQTCNVHARAILTEIAKGEHELVDDGGAFESHPWLLERLRESLSIERGSVRPLAPVLAFIGRLAAHVSDPLGAIAFIGIGNELIIVPEYREIERCFRAQAKDSEYQPFLEANIVADVDHARMCVQLAAKYISLGASRDAFLGLARDAIASRVTYFDDLYSLARAARSPT